MAIRYKVIDSKDAEGVAVTYVGVYVLNWQREWGTPEVCILEEDDEDESRLDTALSALREIVEKDAWGYRGNIVADMRLIARAALKEIEADSGHIEHGEMRACREETDAP